MDFNALLSFDLWPAPFELVLHIAPDLSRLSVELMHLDFGGLFELIESEFALDDSRLEHKELQLGKG